MVVRNVRPVNERDSMPSERRVPAHEQGSAFRSQLGESLRPPNLSRWTGEGGNDGSECHGDGTRQEVCCHESTTV
jgi:hypothetical protein